ncbi:MAG: hypothetical protein K1X86_11990 [Ignavibacteria bacterium]|nr:hypothetical protein [Ignavibacteria bacterium]
MSINTRNISDVFIDESQPNKLPQIFMSGTNYTVDFRYSQLRVTIAPWEIIRLTEEDIFKIKLRMTNILKRRKCTARKLKRI